MHFQIKLEAEGNKQSWHSHIPITHKDTRLYWLHLEMSKLGTNFGTVKTMGRDFPLVLREQSNDRPPPHPVVALTLTPSCGCGDLDLGRVR